MGSVLFSYGIAHFLILGKIFTFLAFWFSLQNILIIAIVITQICQRETASGEHFKLLKNEFLWK